VLASAESARRSYKQLAETTDRLADTGQAEHATRRRLAAERARRLADQEARQIAELSGEGSGPADQGRGTAARPAANPDVNRITELG
jgi:hypothetical protein